MKTCTKCKACKPLTEFYRRGSGAVSHCKQCKKAHQQGAEQMAMARERRNRWAAANPESNREAKRRWRERNRDHARAIDRTKYDVDRYPESVIRYRLKVSGFPEGAITADLIAVRRLTIQIRKLTRGEHEEHR
jgi:hypothetical protein